MEKTRDRRRVTTSDWFQDVFNFHKKFCPDQTNSMPIVPNDDRLVGLRQDLIREESAELLSALDAGDLAEIADASADLIYVILGTCVYYGIDLRPVWDEVQRTNMAKEGGPTRADGKILKPEGWTPPDITRILATQAPLLEAEP